MHVTVIINPTSGTRGRHPEVARRRAQLAKDLFSSMGVEHEVLITERAGHAYELARQAVDRHISLVYAWGGDGTMNEVGRALAFGPTALALIPAGSGNGLARDDQAAFQSFGAQSFTGPIHIACSMCWLNRWHNATPPEQIKIILIDHLCMFNPPAPIIFTFQYTSVDL